LWKSPRENKKIRFSVFVYPPSPMAAAFFCLLFVLPLALAQTCSRDTFIVRKSGQDFLVLNSSTSLWACGATDVCSRLNTAVQNLGLSGDDLSISGGNTITLPYGRVADVSAGTGLSKTGTATNIILSADPATVQSRVLGSCSAGNAVSAIAQNGGVTCSPFFWLTDTNGIRYPGRVGINANAVTSAQVNVVGTTVNAAVKGQEVSAAGYLGVDGGSASFDGWVGVDLNSGDYGTVGVSMDTTTTDNFGVGGFSNGVGVHGESTTSTYYADLGTGTYALYASGPSYVSGQLTVVGNLILSSAYNFQFSAPRTYYRNLNALVFTSTDVDFCQSSGFWSPCATATGFISARAAFSLPNGATIVDLDGYYQDSSTTSDATFSMSLWFVGNTVGSITQIGTAVSVATTATTPTTVQRLLFASVNHVVDNFNNAYYVYTSISPTGTTGLTALRFWNLRITYRLTNLAFE
jgi:hypothetical protein